jgi:outer membrane receptor protein involved in Fe transport
MGKGNPQVRINTLTRCLMLSLAVAAGGMAPMMNVHAQSQQPVAGAVEFNIPAGELAAALDRFAEQSGLQIVSDQSLQGIKAPALQGRFAPEQALARLLRGSGFTYQRLNAQTFVLKKQPPSGPKRGKVQRIPDTAQSAEQEVQKLEQVTVTGSRIRGAPPASPVTTLTREDMARAGYVDLGDAGRGLLQNFSGGQNPGVAGGGDQGGAQNVDNSSALNLRGLGPDATLTLVNGHRVAYDGAVQGVDIAAIPIAAVERVEVVTDGASALYGSDAVGGVANVILRRDFQGVEASARYGGSTDGGDQQQEYSVTTGGRWASGGVMAAFDYSRYTAVNARDRSYTQGLYGTQTLLPGQEQHSAVLAGHQHLTNRLELELDASINDRSSELVNDFTTTGPVTAGGIHQFSRVESYELTPTLRYRLPGGWEASLSGTHARSKTAVHGPFFSQGAELFRTTVLYDNVTDSAELNAEGPLFSAPGGEARLAVGGGYRSAELHANAVRTGVGVNSTTDFTDSRDVYFEYAELSVPLVSPNQNLRFARELTFNAAFRHEDYRGLWDVTTPKLGLIFAPTADVTLRATWGKSFKAATLYQEHTLASAYILSGSYYSPPPTGGRPVLTVGGTPGPLDPERATTWTASIGVHPGGIPDLAIEATYFDIRYRDRIASPLASTLTALGNPIYDRFITYDPTIQQVLDAIADLPGGFSNQTGEPFDPANVGAIIDDSLSNVARANLSGVDFTGSYGMDVGAKSRLILTASASYLESDRQLSEGQPTQQLSGLIFNPPHWRARASATWQRSNLTLTGTVNYIGGERDNHHPPVAQIGSFTTLDTVAQIQLDAGDGFFRGCRIGLLALNLLNEKPETIRNTIPTDPPYDSLNYSTVGRFLGVTFTKKFL